MIRRSSVASDGVFRDKHHSQVHRSIFERVNVGRLVTIVIANTITLGCSVMIRGWNFAFPTSLILSGNLKNLQAFRGCDCEAFPDIIKVTFCHLDDVWKCITIAHPESLQILRIAGEDQAGWGSRVPAPSHY